MVSDDGNSLPKTVECHIENEDKDIGWAYCSFVGHCFSEAVSITAVKGPIESIEWGAPIPLKVVSNDVSMRCFIINVSTWIYIK